MDFTETEGRPNLGRLPAWDGPSMRCERAASELRYGRPVVLYGEIDSYVLISLETATPENLRWLQNVTSDRLALYLSSFRAKSVGVANQESGVVVPSSGLTFEEMCKIAYGLRHDLPTTWQAAPSEMGAAAEMARLSSLLPAVVFAAIDPNDPAFRHCAGVSTKDICVAKDTSGRAFSVIVRTMVPLEGLGLCELVIFRGGVAQRDQVAIIVGQPEWTGAVPVRIHSSCVTGDLLGSLKCDCGDQLRKGMDILADLGGGVMLYLDHEGRGTGLASKMRAYSYQDMGLDTIDADAELGFGPDERGYDAAVEMLRALEIVRVNLITNNPLKAAFLADRGIEVDRTTPVTGRYRAENARYLQTKATRSQHSFPLEYICRSGWMGE